MPRPLTPSDAERYIALRQRMIVESPYAFLGVPGDDDMSDLEIVRTRLADPDNAMVGVDADASILGRTGVSPVSPTCKQVGPPDVPLVAVAGVYRSVRTKFRHKATIVSVYVAPEARGRGYGRAVMQAVIDIARSWTGIRAINISAVERSTEACALYTSMGFRQWGIEPNATIVDGELLDEIVMQMEV